MEYRKLPKGGEQISILGLGNSSMGTSGEKEVEAAVTMAVDNGINYFDMAAADAVRFAPFGRAVEGCRDKVYFQVHFGAEYRTGTYGWTLNLEKIKRSVDWQLEMLKTDYIDFGFIHCIDEAADLEKVISGGTLDYMKELKADGVIRHIGLSSHTPEIVEKVLDMGLIDMLMFSINPAYDYRHGEYAIENWDYLYDSNWFNDIKYYFNSHDLMCILIFSESPACVGIRKDLDRPNAWYASPFHNSRFGGVENWVKHYTNDQLSFLLTKTIPSAIQKQSESENLVNEDTILQIDTTVTETIEKFVKKYPQTNFYCYFNPDSLLAHSIENAFGIFGFYKEFVRETVNKLAPYQNVKIFGFDNLEFTQDLSYYKDLTHYKPEINSMILKLIGRGEYRLNSNNVDSYLTKLTERVETYDLVAFNEMIQKGINELSKKSQ